ncbi:rhodanese-like domain-containing protein [Paenibacillus sp. ACRRX]|uniref:rhodanese-like domain-containing protein n=1 Tax=unclassified Paenibacillus TaxID=185978 RepID=UPI001EF5085C|nr:MULTISPECIES: rhodanese-like domain-containing protein [unclassified Paenibacillus]MCG7407646.1 rhodanese-like domain-containing protein [Paenibacillus sp. ACRRX]MDK8180881.1 rhodanese-like domain-containing protein [Paenibacillus sp. UMB4589-SE434]
MNTIPQINVSELKLRLERGEALNLIDVREHEEVAQGIIPGAKHIPMNEIPDRIQEVERTSEIIFICRSGYRSERVCEYLQHLGIEGAVNMEGGMLAWADIEGPIQF